jgi:hypothetical protein
LIVVSGALVLVALVFLIIGLFGEGLGFIWASIVTSIVAGVFLLLGALQRRGTPATTADSGPTSPQMLERVTAVSVRPRDESVEDAPAEDAPASAGEVAVVPGRPRYHVPGCRFLAGRPDVETVAVEDARGEGYTACGVCKPDQSLAAAAPAAPAEEAEEAEPVAEEPTFEAPAEEPAEEDTAILAAPTTRTARKAPAKKAAAATKPAKAAATATATKAAKPAAKATKAAAAGSVVAVPDRGKYHLETCRFAQNAPGALTMTKTSAKRQGLAPCGVCKPG